MILDELKNTNFYQRLHPSFEKAFTFLLTQDLHSLPVGRIDLEDEDFYVLIQKYQTKLSNQGVWEAHQRYIDIQFMLLGSERIGISSCSKMKLGDYSPETDFQAMSGKGQQIILQAGFFVVLFPQDAHMPCLAVKEPSTVRKIVLKIRM